MAAMTAKVWLGPPGRRKSKINTDKATLLYKLRISMAVLKSLKRNENIPEYQAGWCTTYCHLQIGFSSSFHTRSRQVKLS